MIVKKTNYNESKMIWNFTYSPCGWKSNMIHLLTRKSEQKQTLSEVAVLYIEKETEVCICWYVYSCGLQKKIYSYISPLNA